MMAGVQPLGIHHVSINVTDVEAALQFYVGRLGGVSRSDRPDFAFAGAWIDFAGQQLHLIQGTVPAGHGQHFAVLVADLAATVGELRDAGLRVSDPSPVGPNLQSFVHDPDGNLVELHQAR